MEQYRKLGYGEIDIICQTPQIFLDRFDPKEKYVSVYDGFQFTPCGISNESGVNYNSVTFTFTGHDGADEYVKNLFYVCREDGLGLRKETNEKNGERNGVQRSYRENLVLWTEEHLVDGLYDGPRIFYHTDGHLDKVAMYRKNKQLCMETMQLKWTQKIKSWFGAEQDVETANREHWNRIKKLHPDLAW